MKQVDYVSYANCVGLSLFSVRNRPNSDLISTNFLAVNSTVHRHDPLASQGRQETPIRALRQPVKLNAA